jgi:RNA polymerase sigma factor (sigma-70 family)
MAFIIAPMSDHDHLLSALQGPAAFRTTRWSLIVRATGAEDRQSTEALEQLCRTYWYPLYAYVRRRGYTADDAQDLTQGFFESLLQRQDLGAVAPEKGRFRTFLLSALGHYLANEWRRGQRQKRGGGQAVVSFDALPAEERLRLEPTTSETPERRYDRQWAWTVMDQAMSRLGAGYARTGKADLFEVLKPLLSPEQGGASRTEIATRLGISVGAVDVALLRLRRRYGEILRELIADTVSTEDEVDAEIRHLMAVLSG